MPRPRVIPLFLMTSVCALSACNKDNAAPAPAASPPVAAPAPQAPSPPPPTVAAAPPPAPTPPPPAPTGPEPSESKEMLGLKLAKVGKWKPVWDADQKYVRWENPKYLMSGILVRISRDKLDSMDDLKEAAPMNMQLGSAITKVDEEKKTSKGWYAVVERDKETDFVYIQKYGSKTLLCSANMTKGSALVGNIPKKDALKACDSIKVKS
jgi:hypothetical protein